MIFSNFTVFKVVYSKFCNWRWNPKFGFVWFRATRQAFNESYQGSSVMVIMYDIAIVVLRLTPAKLYLNNNFKFVAEKWWEHSIFKNQPMNKYISIVQTSIVYKIDCIFKKLLYILRMVVWCLKALIFDILNK